MPNYYANTDIGKLSLTELWNLTRSPIAWLSLVFRYKVFGSPTVFSVGLGDDHLSNQWGDVSQLQEPQRSQLERATEEGSRAGLHQAVFAEADTIGPIQVSLGLQHSPDGLLYLSHIACRCWESGLPVESMKTGCVTPLSDGTFLVSSNSLPELDHASEFRAGRKVGASLSELVDFHRQRLAKLVDAQPRLLRSDADVIRAQQQVEKLATDFMVRRGFSRKLTDQEANELRSRFESTKPVMAFATDTAEIPYAQPSNGRELAVSEFDASETTVEPDSASTIHHDLSEPSVAPNEEATRYHAVMNAIEQTTRAKSSWYSNLMLLVLSIAGFVAAGFGDFGFESLVGLLVVLFIHEAGHYAAMSFFGYRNVRMFFIPFLGAAVSGRHYNIAGWKKAIVSLAGPIPGILIGSALLAQPWWQQAWVTSLAYWFVGLNVFNLLPFLPLDGGWVVHAVISSRNRWLELIARVIGPAAMILFGVYVSSFVLVGFGALMLTAVSTQFKLSGVTARLRAEHLPTEAAHDELPTQTAMRIIDEIEEVVPNQHPGILATYTTTVFEALNAKPPGVFASLAILATHVCGFALPFVAVAIGGALSLFQPDVSSPASPMVSISAEQPLDVEVGDFYEPSEDTTLLMIVKEEDSECAQAMEDVCQFVGEDHAATRFDKLVFLDVAEYLESKAMQKQLRAMGHTVYSFRPAGPVITIDLGEPTEANLSARQQLNGYLRVSPICKLIPPWHSTLTIEREQVERRKQVGKLVSFLDDVALSPENQRLYDEVGKLYEQESVDYEEIVDLEQQADRMLRQNTIAAAFDAQADGELSDLPRQLVSDYLKVVNPGPTPEQMSDKGSLTNWKQSMVEFGAGLGQLPLKDNKVAFEDLSYGCIGSITLDEDRHIYLSLHFNDPSVALPHMVRWLEDHGCDEIRLRVESQFALPRFGELQDNAL